MTEFFTGQFGAVNSAVGI